MYTPSQPPFPITPPYRRNPMNESGVSFLRTIIASLLDTGIMIEYSVRTVPRGQAEAGFSTARAHTMIVLSGVAFGSVFRAGSFAEPSTLRGVNGEPGGRGDIGWSMVCRDSLCIPRFPLFLVDPWHFRDRARVRQYAKCLA